MLDLQQAGFSYHCEVNADCRSNGDRTTVPSTFAIHTKICLHRSSKGWSGCHSFIYFVRLNRSCAPLFCNYSYLTTLYTVVKSCKKKSLIFSFQFSLKGILKSIKDNMIESLNHLYRYKTEWTPGWSSNIFPLRHCEYRKGTKVCFLVTVWLHYNNFSLYFFSSFNVPVLWHFLLTIDQGLITRRPFLSFATSAYHLSANIFVLCLSTTV